MFLVLRQADADKILFIYLFIRREEQANKTREKTQAKTFYRYMLSFLAIIDYCLSTKGFIIISSSFPTLWHKLTVILKSWFDISEQIFILMVLFATFLDCWELSSKMGLVSIFAQLLDWLCLVLSQEVLKGLLCCFWSCQLTAFVFLEWQPNTDLLDVFFHSCSLDWSQWISFF